MFVYSHGWIGVTAGYWCSHLVLRLQGEKSNRGTILNPVGDINPQHHNFQLKRTHSLWKWGRVCETKLKQEDPFPIHKHMLYIWTHTHPYMCAFFQPQRDETQAQNTKFCPARKKAMKNVCRLVLSLTTVLRNSQQLCWPTSKPNDNIMQENLFRTLERRNYRQNYVIRLWNERMK